MTKDSLSDTAALRALLSETSDTNLLAEMLGFVADRLMALDVDQICGAGAHERNAERVNHRNGYLWLDATYIKVRRGGRIVSVAAIVAVAVNLDGRREVLLDDPHLVRV